MQAPLVQRYIELLQEVWDGGSLQDDENLTLSSAISPEKVALGDLEKVKVNGEDLRPIPTMALTQLVDVLEVCHRVPDFSPNLFISNDITPASVPERK